MAKNRLEELKFLAQMPSFKPNSYKFHAS